ncbi:MAG: histidine phosphatase family protein [Clostridia bacterium]|nr:histidine phosphatase family protein [Clostridia bacterium]
MIYIVRHGQTDWNVEGRYGGRTNIPINETGIEQAKQVKELLKDIDFDIVISSPLIRAYKTAQIITDKDIITDERIVERSNGELEGKLKTEIAEIINYNDENEKRYNIESIVEFRKRIKSFFDEITSKYKKENVLVVTHAGVGLYTRCYFEGEPVDGDYSKYKMKNCEVLKYENQKY